MAVLRRLQRQSPLPFEAIGFLFVASGAVLVSRGGLGMVVGGALIGLGLLVFLACSISR